MVRTIIFSLALIIAASVLGYQVKQVGGGHETISVKGLAEKPVRADRAEWTVRLQVKGATLAEALGTALLLTVVIGSDGSLSIPGKVLTNPFHRNFGSGPHTPEIIWLDAAANVEYALSGGADGT